MSIKSLNRRLIKPEALRSLTSLACRVISKRMSDSSNILNRTEQIWNICISSPIAPLHSFECKSWDVKS